MNNLFVLERLIYEFHGESNEWRKALDSVVRCFFDQVMDIKDI